MKDIQSVVYNLLVSIDSIDEVYNYAPNVLFEEGEQVIVVFNETENLPYDYFDNTEFTSIIYYNIDIYSKTPNTLTILQDIEELLYQNNFVRIAAGQQRYYEASEYYTRLTGFKIKI